MEEANEEDVDFMGSPLHTYFKEIGLSDAATGCEPRDRAKKRSEQPGVTSSQLSAEQRETIECILQSGADLLIDEDDALLTSLRRELSRNKAESESQSIVRRLLRLLKSAGFSFRHQVGMVFCLVSVLVTLSVNFPHHVAFAAACLVTMALAYGATRVARQRVFERERSLVRQSADALLKYAQTSRKAVLLVQETNLLARGYLLPTGGEATLGGGSKGKEDMLFCASLNVCLTRTTRTLAHCVAQCCRSLVSASRHLTVLEVLQDCLAQEDAQEDAQETVDVAELKRRHTRLVAHCSEYLRLLALAHCQVDTSRLRLQSASETARFAAIHKRLLHCATESLSTLQTCYYVNFYGFDADAHADADGQKPKQKRKVDDSSQLNDFAHAAFLHTRSALLQCARLDLYSELNSNSNSNLQPVTATVGDTQAKETLEGVAAALERARECVALALALTDQAARRQLPSAAPAPPAYPSASLAAPDDDQRTLLDDAPAPVCTDLFLEADLRHEARHDAPASTATAADAFAARQRALADRMLREIRPALQVRAADFRERERRFKQERDLPLPDEETETETETADRLEVESKRLRHRLLDADDDEDDADEGEDDETPPPLVSVGAPSNLLAQLLVAQHADALTDRRRHEDTFELDADADADADDNEEPLNDSLAPRM